MEYRTSLTFVSFDLFCRSYASLKFVGARRGHALAILLECLLFPALHESGGHYNSLVCLSVRPSVTKTLTKIIWYLACMIIMTSPFYIYIMVACWIWDKWSNVKVSFDTLPVKSFVHNTYTDFSILLKKKICTTCTLFTFSPKFCKLLGKLMFIDKSL